MNSPADHMAIPETVAMIAKLKSWFDLPAAKPSRPTNNDVAPTIITAIAIIRFRQ